MERCLHSQTVKTIAVKLRGTTRWSSTS